MYSTKLSQILCAFFMVLSLTVPAFAADEVEAPIKSVTVYLDRAKITRVAELELMEGDHSLLIKKLPYDAIESSFRSSVAGVEGITLMGMSQQTERHLEDPQENIAALEKQIEEINQKTRLVLNGQIEAFKQQKMFLQTLIMGSAENSSEDINKGVVDVAQWEKAYDFIGQKLREVNDSILIYGFKVKQAEEKLKLLTDQLNTIRTDGNKSSWTVQVDLNLKKEGKVYLNLEYIIQNASWKPFYDARLDRKTNKVNLSYFARISQHTGEDWNDVNLTLSTNRPSQGIGPGEFRPWLLGATAPVQTVDELLEQVARVETTSTGEVFIRGSRAGELAYIVDGVPIADPVGGIDIIRGKILSADLGSETYEIKRKETIPSGEQSARVVIAQWTLEADKSLISRPKYREGVYRLLTVKNQDTTALIPGQVAIFAGTDFIGNTVLPDLVAPAQSFELPFGLEDMIKIEREIVSYGKSTRGNKNKVEFVIKITLTNNDETKQSVHLEEPLPVTQDKRIKVDFNSLEPEPVVNTENGRAEWLVILEPGQVQEIKIAYKIEYPIDIYIPGI